MNDAITPTFDLPQIKTSEFLDALQLELAGRCRKNPRYSLRSFARALDVSPSFLSKLLTGKRPLTEATFNKLAAKLLLTPKQIESFKSTVKKKSKSSLSQAYEKIQLDQFELIAEWYHFAILELVTVSSFQDDNRWIAQQLGINQHQVSDAMQRLLRLGYIKRQNGKLRLVRKNNTTIGPEIGVPATTKQQTQFLAMATEALTNVPISRRSQTSMTMAIPSSQVENAKQLIMEFRRNITSLLQQSPKRDMVYQLVISFFPLSKTTPDKGNRSIL